MYGIIYMSLYTIQRICFWCYFTRFNLFQDLYIFFLKIHLNLAALSQNQNLPIRVQYSKSPSYKYQDGAGLKSYSHTLRSLQLSSVCSNSPCYWLTVIQSLPCTPEADPLVQTSCPEPGIPHQVLDLEYTTYTKHITCFT